MRFRASRQDGKDIRRGWRGVARTSTEARRMTTAFRGKNEAHPWIVGTYVTIPEVAGEYS